MEFLELGRGLGGTSLPWAKELALMPHPSGRWCIERVHLTEKKQECKVLILPISKQVRAGNPHHHKWKYVDLQGAVAAVAVRKQKSRFFIVFPHWTRFLFYIFFSSSYSRCHCDWTGGMGKLILGTIAVEAVLVLAFVHGPLMTEARGGRAPTDKTEGWWWGCTRIEEGVWE